MPVVYIDLSVFTNKQSVGTVSGTINVPIEPQVGDSLSFKLSNDDLKFSDNYIYSGIFNVANRIIIPNSEATLMLSLEDLLVPTREDAEVIMKAVSSQYGLQFDFFE